MFVCFVKMSNCMQPYILKMERDKWQNERDVKRRGSSWIGEHWRWLVNVHQMNKCRVSSEVLTTHLIDWEAREVVCKSSCKKVTCWWFS